MQWLSLDSSEADAKAWLETQYKAQTFGLGYSYFYGPSENLTDARILTVGLNPGGDFVGDLAWDQSCFNAYLDQDWGNQSQGIQTQMRRMLAALGAPHGERVTSLQYVPFRSPSIEQLPNAEHAFAIADNLWDWVMHRSSPALIVAVGKSVGERIALRMGGLADETVPLGWGRQTGRRFELQNGADLVVLPHLSRYQIFGRAQSSGGIERLFGKHLKARV